VLAPGLLRARLGTVVAFDVDAGLGEVATDGGEVFGFHCTAIAGGGRVISAGTVVVFSLRAFHRGELQASDLVSLTA
jgi:cold shock CspA family protein